jgi:hypothetical protein
LIKMPPRTGGFSTKNSHTAPKAIAIQRNRAEALALRERGLTYEAIAKEMKRPVGTINRWIFECLDQMIAEPAAKVLKLELTRLDALLNAALRVCASR